MGGGEAGDVARRTRAAAGEGDAGEGICGEGLAGEDSDVGERLPSGRGAESELDAGDVEARTLLSLAALLSAVETSLRASSGCARSPGITRSLDLSVGGEQGRRSDSSLRVTRGVGRVGRAWADQL